MRKLLSLMLIVLIGALLVVSCNDSPSPSPTPTPTDPERPATLTLASFREYYAKSPTSKPIGSIYYTDTKGKITTLSLTDEGVTTDFDSKTVGEKTLKISYKGIDCVAKYTIVEVGEVSVKGAYIVDKNTVLVFEEDEQGNKTVKREYWNNWGAYYNLSDDPDESEPVTYTPGISAAGKTIVTVDIPEKQYKKNLYPDGIGGLLTYPSEAVYFGSDSNYVPNTDYLYVSRSKEDKRSAGVANDKYLVIGFNYNGTMFMWFVANLDEEETLKKLKAEDAKVVISASDFIFDSSGAYFETFTPDAYKGQGVADNLRLMLNKDGYASTESAFSIVSSSEGTYKGYAYTMKLTSVPIPDDLPDPNVD